MRANCIPTSAFSLSVSLLSGKFSTYMPSISTANTLSFASSFFLLILNVLLFFALSGEVTIRKPQHAGPGGQHPRQDHHPPHAAGQQSTRMVQTQRLKELSGQGTQAQSGCADGQANEHETLRV